MFDTSTGGYVYQVVADKFKMLTDTPVDTINNQPHSFVYGRWDAARSQFIAVQTNGDVVAYDLETGSVAGFFHNHDTHGRPAFIVSRDNTKIVVFSGGWGAYMAVWDRSTLQEMRLTSSGGYTAQSADYVDISPDNRYLVAGYLHSYQVWDLANLSPNLADRLPVRFTVPVVYAKGIHFVDNEHINLSTPDNPQIVDIHTGELVSSS